jgi:predicted methyltransferase
MRHRTWIIAAAVATATVPVLAAAPRALVVTLASAERPEADKVRDADRKPAELMAFAGVRAGSKIAEIAPGGGYFTRLLSLAVGPRGHVWTANTRAGPAIEAWAANHPNTTMQIVAPGGAMAPEAVDIVWTTLNYHDFKNNAVDGTDAAAKINTAAFAALKPGGTYLVVDHAAAAGAGVNQTNTLHRIESAVVVREVEAAGFRLAARSTLLAHPADDHTRKVVETGIRGKTDQFVLKFVKPRGRPSR